MTLASWLHFLHLAYKSLQQANKFEKDILIKTIQLNTLDSDVKLPIISKRTCLNDDFIAIKLVMQGIQSINQSPLQWEYVTNKILQIFFEQKEEIILFPQKDINVLKSQCLKVLKDNSILLDLTSWKVASPPLMRLFPILSNLNLYNQNLKALSL